jgi:hypothetical protein
MKSSMPLIGALLMMLMAASPVRADHDSPPPADHGATVTVPGTSSSLDINLKLRLNGFRLGSRLFGKEGYAGGAWLNGEARSDGFSIDGRLERDGKAHNFKLNADIDEWLRRAFRWGAALDL